MKKLIITATIIGLLCPIIAIALDSSTDFNAVHIRSLAASCAACHGTQGNTVKSGAGESSLGKIPTLAGINRTDFITKLQAFKSGERTSTVMHHHAKGLNLAEIEALSDYFSAQPTRASTPLISQKLLADHAN